MKSKRLHTKFELKEKRKYLRENMTPAEAFLWKHVKARQLEGRRFTRQHSIGNYIVEFYCAQEKLIIELDGEVHNNASAQEHDEKRTKFLNKMGYQILRFENKLVFEALSGVLREITSCFSE